jgi:hypothetical protein
MLFGGKCRNIFLIVWCKDGGEVDVEGNAEWFSMLSGLVCASVTVRWRVK